MTLIRTRIPEHSVFMMTGQQRRHYHRNQTTDLTCGLNVEIRITFDKFRFRPVGLHRNCSLSCFLGKRNWLKVDSSCFIWSSLLFETFWILHLNAKGGASLYDRKKIRNLCSLLLPWKFWCILKYQTLFMTDLFSGVPVNGSDWPHHADRRKTTEPFEKSFDIYFHICSFHMKALFLEHLWI